MNGEAMETADWQARANHIRAVLGNAGVSDTTLVEVLGAFRFADPDGKVWTYNGGTWLSWDGTAWVEGTPPPSMKLESFATPPTTGSDAQATASEQPLAAAETIGATGATSTELPAAGVSESAGAGADEETAERASLSQPATVQPSAFGSAWESTGQAASPAGTQSTSPTASGPSTMPSATAASSATTAQSPWQSGTPAVQPVGQQPSGSQPAWPQAAPQPSVTPAAGAPYLATHLVPQPGLPAWSRPDPNVAPEQQLWGGMDVMVVEFLPSGWARIVASNGWTAWVDGRYLTPVGRR